MANPYIKGLVEGEVSGIPADMQPQLLRKQKLAEQLLAQGQQPLEGQMVGGQYVAPSWTQYLAKGLQSYMGGKGLRDVENQQTEALKAKREAIANILKGQTPQMVGDRQETPEEVQARLRPQMYEAVSQYGNDPALQLALGDLNYSRERGARKQDLAEERAYTDTREEKLYNRNRADKLSDTQADHEFQRILEKDRQGFQLTQQDRQFAQAYKMQQAQQAFTAQQQRQNQAFQAGQNQLTREQQVELAKAKAGASGVKLNPTLQKEIFEADDLTQRTSSALDMLKQAKELNKKAYSGIGAKPRAVIASNLGFGEGGADATVNLDNLMAGQALETLKSTFGAAPTEGERKILLELQASVDKTPKQREDILNRAIDMANRRLQFNVNKSKQLRTGEYFNQMPALPQSQGGVNFLGFE